MRCRPTYRRQTDDLQPLKRKVFLPAIVPWMEQLRNRNSERINARQVWSLPPIAVRTGKGEICDFVAASVLARSDMLDVKANSQAFLLRQATVLAPVTGPLADELADRFFHA
jgi:hypothetical protein